MPRASVFPYIRTMVSNSSIFFFDSFSTNITFFCIFFVILVLFLLTVTFFLVKINYIFLACSLKESQNVFIQLLCNIKYAGFLNDRIPKLLIIHKKYAHLLLLLKNFSIHLFFLIKDSRSAI